MYLRRQTPNPLQLAALHDAAREPIHRIYGSRGVGFWARGSIATVEPERDPCHHGLTVLACGRRGWLTIAPAPAEPFVHVATLTPAGREALGENIPVELSNDLITALTAATEQQLESV
jgi:hypothetical protein